jgi:hypothetical protein
MSEDYVETTTATEVALPNSGPRLATRNHYLIRDATNKGFVVPEFLANQGTLDVIAPPQFVKSFEQRLAELTEKERDFFDELIKIVREEKGWTTEEVDDWGVIRFMKARPKGVQQAVKMLDTHVQWKASSKPQEVNCTACITDKDAHMQQFVGWDVLHRPVVYSAFKWAKADTRTLAPEAVEHNVECFRHCIELMPEGVEQWVNVVDFLTYSHWTDGRAPVAKAVMDVMEANYPERLGLQFLVDPPTAFFVLLKMLSPFLAANTMSKVKMVYTDKQPNIRDEFPKVFAPHLSDYLIETLENNKLAYKQEQAATKKGGWLRR